jgi:hypothetical protein
LPGWGCGWRSSRGGDGVAVGDRVWIVNDARRANEIGAEALVVHAR